ncbi:hypothetical protein BJV82DRAFT_600063 [Fennellomyces sp. T-0311]|nr:hypothetical protein BJV82DRAFT_600063 [Fennellomyces sp. T-0311]
MHSWRESTTSPPLFDGESSSEQLQFASEPSLTKVSLFDDSFNIIGDEPSFHPSSSPLPLEIPESFRNVDEEKTPLPDKQNGLDAANNLLATDHSSLFDQESRIEHQFELLSMADANMNGSDKQSRSDEQKERSTTLTLKEQEKVPWTHRVAW